LKRFGLSATERIRSKNEFDLLYSSGKTIVSASQKFKAVFFFGNNSNPDIKPEVKVAFAVHRKAGKAVWRNRVKRLLRVSFRLNKELLVTASVSKNKFLLVAFSPFSVNSKNYKNINLKDVMPDIIDLISSIRQRL
jgi:ribonuclease P protein component